MALDDYTRRAIRFWEIRRIIFCVGVAFPAWMSYMMTSGIQAGLDYPQNGTTSGVALRFAYLFVWLNICFSFAYAAEFIFRSTAFWPSWGRHLAFVVGLLLGLWLAFSEGGRIGIYEFSFR